MSTLNRYLVKSTPNSILAPGRLFRAESVIEATEWLCLHSMKYPGIDFQLWHQGDLVATATDGKEW